MADAVYIYDAVRTPRGRGKSSGSLHEVPPVKLATGVLKEIQQRNGIQPTDIDCVVMGCVTAVFEQGASMAKTAAYMAYGESVPGIHVNAFCASGLTATNLGAQRIASGSDDLVVTGGVESMSRVKMGSDGGPMAMNPDVSLAHKSVPQGIGADLIATIEGFSRTDVDEFALRSQQLATKAREEGRFKKSLVPVRDDNGVVILDHDEFIRPETTLEALGALNASFEMMGQMGFDDYALSRYLEVETINHVHTPGNSSGIVDGSAAVLMGSENAGKRLGLKPRGRLLASTLMACDPCIMLVGPGPATHKVLKKAGLTMDQIDLFEVNEAFASVVLRFLRDTDVPLDKVNVNGGSIALGHPIGATGAMILGTLLDELERQDLRYGVATLCAGGGMGVATVIERMV